MSRNAVVLVIAGLLCLPGWARAQEIGIKGGLTFADIPNFGDVLDDEGFEAVKRRTGLVIGGHVGIPLAGLFTLQPEVLYTQRGVEADLPFVDETFKFNLDYLDVPVLLRVGPSSGFQFLVGPSFNFNTGATIKSEGIVEGDEDFKDDVEDVEVGLVLGGGYYGGLLVVEGRYQEGLTNIAKFEEFEFEEDYRNRSFTLLVGVRFGR
jgi:hypothetical protein